LGSKSRDGVTVGQDADLEVGRDALSRFEKAEDALVPVVSAPVDPAVGGL
jgi:hypothetical protein